MKLKSLIIALLLIVGFAMPTQAQKVTKKAQVSVSTATFNTLKQNVSNDIAKMKKAASATEVANIMYDYTKNLLMNAKEFQNLSDYQKKQIDVLTKQFGIESQAKIAKYNCKQQSDAAIQKATMEALSALKK